MTFRKYPLLSCSSARTLTLAIKRSSYPRNSCRINRLKESPKHLSVSGSRRTILIGIPNLCRVAADSLKNPYSSESTIYKDF